MDKRILERAGLSKGEIEVFVALLKLGDSLVSKIAQETGLHRTNIYDTLEKLREKGLVSYVIKENRKYFSASNPDKLLDYIKEREAEIKNILPKLKSYTSFSRSESIVEVYKGKEGLKTVLKDILKQKQNYVVFEEQGYIEKVLPYFYPQFNKQMNKKKIKVKVLTKNTKKIAKRSLMEIRTLPEFLSFPSATAVYANKVAIFVWDEPYHAILIKSKQVAEGYKSFFKQLWKVAKK
ncbi:MAG: helix-turn-helix domain-containing protein [Candidatus Pacearchaeota archaeon]|jgi:sugar-specific transcriptional regulator TrmB